MICAGAAAPLRSERAGSAAWLGALLLLLPALVAGEDSWPQWRGPERDGTTRAFQPPERWPEALHPVWRREVGEGHASPVVADGRVLVFSRLGEREIVRALDFASGEELWSDSASAPYRPSPDAAEHGLGPFSTPAVAAGRVYSFGIDETLSAHDVEDGRLLWRRRYAEDYRVPHPLYGTSLSPLVAGGRVVVYVGGPGDGALVALDGETGETLWSLAGEGPPYGSPVAATFEGVHQIVTLTQHRLIGVDAATGALLWEHPFRVQWDNTTATPIVDGGRLLFSSYGVGVHAVRPERRGGAWRLATEWHAREASVFMSNPVLAQGVVYGFSHLHKGQLFALDAGDGALLWTSPGRLAENASVVHASGWLLVLDDGGRLLVGPARPDAWRPVAEYALSAEPVWAHPAVLGDSILVKGRSVLTLWRIASGEGG